MDFKLWLESEWKSIPRQKLFPWMHEPGYLRKGLSFIDKEEIPEDYEPDNVYHVTTNLKGVLQQGKLLPRSILGIEGLGGKEASNKISATYSFQRALEIYEQMKYVMMIVKGQVLAYDIWDNFAKDNYTNSFFNSADEIFEDGQKVHDALSNYLPEKIIEDWNEEKVKKILNTKIRTPKQKYEFFQQLENAFLDIDYHKIMNVVGFTSTFENMNKIDHSQIAIIQLAIKKDAKSQHVPEELELRLNPNDVAVIRYYQK